MRIYPTPCLPVGECSRVIHSYRACLLLTVGQCLGYYVDGQGVWRGGSLPIMWDPIRWSVLG